MESTTDFFAFLWLTERSKHHDTGLEDQIRGDRFDAWMNEDVDLWPYAGAKYCVRDASQQRIYDRLDLHRFDQSADRFTEVLESFVNDGDPIDRTYRILITCQNDGVKTWQCSKCGDTYDEIIPSTGHQYSITVEVRPYYNNGIGGNARVR